MKSVTVENYRKDKYYPRVVRAVAAILCRADVVEPIEVLVEMGNLNKRDSEAWRRGEVPYLERVFGGNLSKASRILRILALHLHDLNMTPRLSTYDQLGSGKNRRLQFSKSGTRRLEEAYSKHYVWNRSQEKKQEIVASLGPLSPAAHRKR